MQLPAHLDAVSLAKLVPFITLQNCMLFSEQSRAMFYSRTRKPKQASVRVLSTGLGEALTPTAYLDAALVVKQHGADEGSLCTLRQ